MASLYQDLSSHKTFSGSIGNRGGMGSLELSLSFLCSCLFHVHIVTFLALGPLLTFCLYSDLGWLLPRFQQHMHPISLRGAVETSRNSTGMWVPHLSCLRLHPQHLAQSLASGGPVMGAEPGNSFCCPRSETHLEKGGSVHHWLDWADGSTQGVVGGEESTVFQLLPQAMGDTRDVESDIQNYKDH